MCFFVFAYIHIDKLSYKYTQTYTNMFTQTRIVKHTLTMTHREQDTHLQTMTYTLTLTITHTKRHIYKHTLTRTYTHNDELNYLHLHTHLCIELYFYHLVSKRLIFRDKKNIIGEKRVIKAPVLLFINSSTFEMYISYIN